MMQYAWEVPLAMRVAVYDHLCASGRRCDASQIEKGPITLPVDADKDHPMFGVVQMHERTLTYCLLSRLKIVLFFV